MTKELKPLTSLKLNRAHPRRDEPIKINILKQSDKITTRKKTKQAEQEATASQQTTLASQEEESERFQVSGVWPPSIDPRDDEAAAGLSHTSKMELHMERRTNSERGDRDQDFKRNTRLRPGQTTENSEHPSIAPTLAFPGIFNKENRQNKGQYTSIFTV